MRCKCRSKRVIRLSLNMFACGLLKRVSHTNKQFGGVHTSCFANVDTRLRSSLPYRTLTPTTSARRLKPRGSDRLCNGYVAMHLIKGGVSGLRGGVPGVCAAGEDNFAFLGREADSKDFCWLLIALLIVRIGLYDIQVQFRMFIRA